VITGSDKVSAFLRLAFCFKTMTDKPHEDDDNPRRDRALIAFGAEWRLPQKYLRMIQAIMDQSGESFDDVLNRILLDQLPYIDEMIRQQEDRILDAILEMKKLGITKPENQTSLQWALEWMKRGDK
jgi:hypothetical protein